MYNYFMLMGLITDIENDNLKLQVVNEFKSKDGQYKIFDYDIKIDEKLREYIKEYICVGNRIGVAGIIQKDNENNIILIAHRVTGLNSFRLE